MTIYILYDLIIRSYHNFNKMNAALEILGKLLPSNNKLKESTTLLSFMSSKGRKKESVVHLVWEGFYSSGVS